MRILCLYNNPCALSLFDWIKSQGHEIICWDQPLDALWCRRECFDLTVSYTYRYILSDEILEALGNNAVNIHNSYLPWNRGADPNIWSLLDNTPRGVTLHYMDANLDKGFIIAQQLIGKDDMETLYTSYRNLDIAAKKLFKEAFPYYRHWKSMCKQPLGKGSYHSIKDGQAIRKFITTYEMNVCELKRLYEEGKCLYCDSVFKT